MCSSSTHTTILARKELEKGHYEFDESSFWIKKISLALKYFFSIYPFSTFKKTDMRKKILLMD